LRTFGVGLNGETIGTAAELAGTEEAAAVPVLLLETPLPRLPLPPVGAALLSLPKPNVGVGSGIGPAGMPKGSGANTPLRGVGPMLTEGAKAVAAIAAEVAAELAALPTCIQEAAGCDAAAAAAARVPKVTPLAPAKPGPATAACE
jgi:hypothetical protein